MTLEIEASSLENDSLKKVILLPFCVFLDSMPLRRGERHLKPTEEQLEILEAFASFSIDMKIQAFAGSGKTTTLRLIAEANPQVRFLYVAFNKALEMSAKSTFPKNVEARTAHSLAYGAMRISRSPFQLRLGAQMRPEEIFEACGIKCLRGVSPYLFWHVIRQTVRAFQNSVDLHVEQWHIPSDALVGPDGRPQGVRFLNAVVKASQKLWKARSNPTSRVPIEHDTYLKLWLLKGGSISADCILFDEAQDANPAMLAIIERQCCRKVFVGDEFQQIYSWRGAVNAMAKIKTPLVRKLTQSFRFGEAIATLGMRALRLKGLPWEDITFHGLSSIPSVVEAVNWEKPLTGLMRTNIGIVEAAYTCAQSKKAFHVVGDFEGTLRFVESAYALLRGRKSEVFDERLRIFNDWIACKAAAKHEADLASVVAIAEKYQKNFDRVMQLIRAFYTRDERAPLVLTTAHKAKGREWGQVFLGEDFCKIAEMYKAVQAGELTELPPEEINVLYVALTRAIRTLSVPGQILDMLEAEASGGQHIPSQRFTAAQCLPGARG
jgi:hypothetical protein